MRKTKMNGELIIHDDGRVELCMVGMMSDLPTPDPKPSDVFIPDCVHSNSSGSYQSFSADGKFIAVRDSKDDWNVHSVATGELDHRAGNVNANDAVMAHFMWSDVDSRYWMLNRNIIELRDRSYVVRTFNLKRWDAPGFHWRAGTGGGANTQFVLAWSQNANEGQHYLQSFTANGLHQHFKFNGSRSFPVKFNEATRFHNVFLRDGFGYAGPFGFDDSRQTYHHMLDWQGSYIGKLQDQSQSRISHPAWSGNRVLFFSHDTGYTSIVGRQYYTSRDYSQTTYIDQEQLQEVMEVDGTYIAGGHIDYRGGKAVFSVMDYKAENKPFALLVWDDATRKLSVAKRGVIKDGNQFSQSLLPSISPTGTHIAYHDDGGVNVVAI